MTTAPAPAWRTIERMEQARWRRFAVAHADQSEVCAELAGAPWISQADAVTLAGVARDNGWTLERAGGAAKPRRR